MKHMKIMFIIDHFGNGGAERVVSLLTDETVRLGHETYVVVNFDERQYELNPGIHYVVTECRHNQSALRKMDRLLSLRRTIRRVKPDVIFSFGYFMNLYSIAACLGLRGRRLIISERTDPNSEPGSATMRRLRNLIYRGCDLLVCQTDDARDYFAAALRKKAVVIPNPIKAGLPRRDPARVSRTIVNACRLEDQKNLPLLIDAFQEVHARYPEYSLVIYGDGTRREQLERQIDALGLQDCVSLPGFQRGLHELMKDCALFASSSDYEGISNSMLEAMGMGMPVVCTDCPIGGASMVIRNGENGLLTPVGDRAALRDAMLRLIEHPQEAEILGKNALQVNEQFAVSRIVKAWLDLC